MSALARTSSAQFFIRALKSCALYREWNSGTGGSVDDSVRIVEKWKSKELEFQNKKLVSEKPTRVRPLVAPLFLWRGLAAQHSTSTNILLFG
jgi:hypothetical protein